MSDLRRVVASLGYADPRTLLNSGNVVFGCAGDAPESAAARIRAALEAQLGIPAPVVVVTGDELSSAIRDNPLVPVADPARFLVAFSPSTVDTGALAALGGRQWAPEVFALRERVAYLWCPGGIAHSALVTAVAKAGGEATTSRNWTTVLKLESMLAQ
jgi:uncharacterized protein (DUF1697 family)